MMKNKILIMMIGISGSGKSTYLKKNIKKDIPELENIKLSDIIVCPDEIRKEITGSVNNNEKDYVIWKYIVPEQLKENLDKYNIAILDGINTTGKSRVKFLKLFKNVTKYAIVFEPDVELSNSRIKKDISEKKDRSNVPYNVLVRQYQNFINSLTSGKEFNKITKEIEDLIKSRLSTVEKFKKIIIIKNK